MSNQPHCRLADDLAIALKHKQSTYRSADTSKGVVGFEVPNVEREVVWMKEIIGSKAFNNKRLTHGAGQRHTR